MPRRKNRKMGAWQFEHTVGIAGATVAKLQTKLDDAISLVNKAVRELEAIVQTEILLTQKFGERPSGPDPAQPVIQALADIERLVKRLEEIKVKAQIEQVDIDRMNSALGPGRRCGAPSSLSAIITST